MAGFVGHVASICREKFLEDRTGKTLDSVVHLLPSYRRPIN